MTATLRLWKDFYPRPPRGGRLTVPAPESFKDEFLSTPSARRATTSMAAAVRPRSFLSTPSARRATITDRAVRYLQTISIHALREEGDVCAIYDISELISFLSTPSARRATCCGPRGGDSGCYFYPRPPRGGRHYSSAAKCFVAGISIHALREEGDAHKRGYCGAMKEFLSTPSARRATKLRISLSLSSFNFYPRPPRGGRREHRRTSYSQQNFYPRPPRGGRQQKQRQNLYFQTNYTTFCTNLEEP